MRVRITPWAIRAPLAVILLLGGASAFASEADMLALPHFDRYGCLNCHNGVGATENSVPTGTEGQKFNAFGVAWLENGQVWNDILAAMNSDKDGCTNGFELGDPGGTWRAGDDRPAIDPLDQSNPGNAADCSLPLSDRTWGVLKALFGDQ